MLTRVVLLIIGYACGLLETAFFIARKKGIDIRHAGSGNTGSTNALRVMGTKSGVLTFAGDFMKSFIPCLAVRLIFRGNELVYLYIAYMGLGVVLGHDFPFYLNWKGGKGVASTAGMAMTMSPVTVLGLIAVFVLIVAVTKYVSLGSVVGMTIYIVLNAVLTFTGRLPIPAGARVEFVILIAVIGILSIVRHKENIVRLKNGKENKFSFRKKI